MGVAYRVPGHGKVPGRKTVDVATDVGTIGGSNGVAMFSMCALEIEIFLSGPSTATCCSIEPGFFRSTFAKRPYSLTRVFAVRATARTCSLRLTLAEQDLGQRSAG